MTGAARGGLDVRPGSVLSCRAVRATCRRCLRPETFCVCRGLGPIPSRTRVVLLQHPREARVAICSARLTRVALANAELHRGISFEDHPRVREVVAAPGTALLFPGGIDAAVAAAAPPPALVVIDGTWLQAEKMLEANPGIAALPRIALSPSRPSGYGELRREPAEGHLSTIEAVALALGALERDPARFEPMGEAFRRAVALQLACAEGDRKRPRHRPSRASRAAAG